MAYRTIDSVSRRINREKGKIASSTSSNVKPSERSIKSCTLKLRIKKQHLQKLASAYLMLLMVFQSLAGVFMWMPQGNEAKASSDWLTGYAYRTPVTVDNNNETALTDYQTKITLQGTDPTASNYIDFDKVLPNGADLRITDSDKVTQIPYWIESWDDTAKTATVWTKVPNVPVSSTPPYYKFSTSQTNHDDYGLSYPVTYEFNIPVGSSDLKAYKKYTEAGSWAQITEKTSTDFFNGIEAARFDYTNNKAYVSVAFDADSNDIYLKVVNESDVQVGIYQKIDKYYDNRQAAVVVTGDDWWGGAEEGVPFSAFSDLLTQDHIWFSPGITTGLNPDWSLIQSKIDAGYLEPMSHSRTHSGVPYSDYDSEIGGSKSDLINNLDLPALSKKGSQEYIYGWLEPGGQSDNAARAKLGQYKYLSDRSINVTNINFYDIIWDSTNGLYNISDPSIEADTNVGCGWATFPGTATLNSRFDSVLASGDIYTLYFHPSCVTVNQLSTHLDYIKEKTNVWYVGFGHLYLYNYTSQRAAQRLATSESSFYLYYGKAESSSLSDYDNTFTKDYGESGLAGLWHMDEGNGGLIDSSGNNYTGTISGALRTSTDGGQWEGRNDAVFSTGSALQFDGIDDKVNFGNVASLQLDTTFTLSAWVKYSGTSSSSSWNPIINKGAVEYSVPYNGFHIGYKADAARWEFKVADSDTASDYVYFYQSYDEVFNIYHHITATFDNGIMRLYIDGKLRSSKLSTAVPNVAATNYNLNLGTYSRSSLYYFNGNIDEARIYNRALSSSEVLSLYQRRKYIPIELSTAVSPSLHTLSNLYKGTTNIISSTDYITYSSEPAVSNLVSSNMSFTPPAGSIDLTLTDTTASVNYANSTLPSMIASSLDRETNFHHNNTTSLAITPSSGTINLTIDTWNTSNDYYKKWTESGTDHDATASHVIGDLKPNAYYSVKTDGNRYNTYLSDENGQINFIYAGGYSTHTFEVSEDTVSPTSFTLISPADGSVFSDTNPTFSWNPSSDSESGILKYQLYIDGIMEKDNIPSDATSATASSNLSCSNHSWQVKAIDKNSNSTDSNVSNLTVSCSIGFVPPAKPSTTNISVSNTNGTLTLSDLPTTITQIAVSTLEDFKDASWEYVKDTASLLAKYADAAKLYIKFRTNDGAVSDTITYNPQADNIQNNNTDNNNHTNTNNTITIEDGDIVKTPNNPDIYVIKKANNKNYKRLILSPNVFNSYQHLKWENVKTISEEELNQYQTSSLVKELTDTIVYTLTPNNDTGKRKPFNITQTYDPDSIYTINKVDRDSYEWEE